MRLRLVLLFPEIRTIVLRGRQGSVPPQSPVPSAECSELDNDTLDGSDPMQWYESCIALLASIVNDHGLACCAVH